MILVTGGTGLVGSHILLELTRKGKKCRTLLRKESSTALVEKLFAPHPELLKSVEWVEGDVTDVYSVFESLEGVEEVYHAAAMISFAPSEVKRMMKVNIEGTANMVNMSLEKGVKKFCHISSVAALGRTAEGQQIDEKSVWKTSSLNSNYAISKYGAEREVWRGIEEGLNAVVLNPTIILGPGDWNKGSAKMIQQVWKGLRFYTPGSTGFVDVRDVAKAAVLLMEKDIHAQRYILNAENVSYKYLFETIASNLHKPQPSIRVSPFLGEVAWRSIALAHVFSKNKPLITKETSRNAQRHWTYSNEKIIRETGMRFIPVSESLAHTCEVFLAEQRGNKN